MPTRIIWSLASQQGGWHTGKHTIILYVYLQISVYGVVHCVRMCMQTHTHKEGEKGLAQYPAGIHFR